MIKYILGCFSGLRIGFLTDMTPHHATVLKGGSLMGFFVIKDLISSVWQEPVNIHGKKNSDL